MDQGSEDGRFGGRFEIIALNSRLHSFPRMSRCWMREFFLLLNKIIQNSYFKKKVSLEDQKAQQEDRFLRGRQIAYMIHGYFRETGAHDTVFDYADLFSVTLRSDDVQEFDTRWDGLLLSMTRIPPNDILESLYKLRIRGSAQLKTARMRSAGKAGSTAGLAPTVARGPGTRAAPREAPRDAGTSERV